MKKLVASVGLVALGASALQQTASAQGLGAPDASKPWSISATLRGFYDDNTATIPDSYILPAGTHKGSFGFEISPAAALAWSLQQTTINVGYVYSLKYFENTPPNSTDHIDSTHTFNVSLTHAFSERYKLQVSDSFVIGQEPDLLRAGNAFSTFQRVPGENMRNYGAISLDAQLTPKFGLGFGYDNAFYDYADDEPIYDNFGLLVSPSNAGLLNRLEHGVHLEGLYSIAPATKGLLGYRFRQVNFTGDQVIGQAVVGNTLQNVMSENRDSRVHTIYVGAEHTFRPDLSAALRVGGSYADYFNDPHQDGSWSPYVDLNLKYTYAPESTIAAGFHYDRNATDVIGMQNTGAYTVDTEAAVVYASINHRITPKLFGSLIGQFQNDAFTGGNVDSETEQYYLLGLNLEYRFNPFLAAHVGYNYDKLNSNIGRTFDRNRVYIGVTASY